MPLQRVETDEWEIDLMAILAAAGIDITDTRLRDLAIGRYRICVACDAASRSVLAAKLSKAPYVEDTLATIWMHAGQDRYRAASGMQTGWTQHRNLFQLAVDNGPALVHVKFEAALSDLGIGYSVMPTAAPKVRHWIERLFRTLATMLMPLLTGRIFSNPTERGDHPSEKCTVHIAESVIETPVRFVLDIYHSRAHEGLDHACQNAAWTRLCAEHGWSPHVGAHRLRHVPGIKLQCKLWCHGILVCGVKYHSEGLALHFQHSGGQSLDIRVDPDNLGHISIWYGDAWHSLPAMIDGMEGVSLASWEQVVLEIRQGNRNVSRLKQDIIDRAFARIQEIDADQRAWRCLGPINVSAADIRRAEAETFFGLKLPPEPEEQPGMGTIASSARGGLLCGVIQPERRHLPPPDQPTDGHPPAVRNNDVPPEIWRFSDDQE